MDLHWILKQLMRQKLPRPVFMTFTKQNAWVDANKEDRPMKRMSNFQFNNIIVECTKGGKNCGFIFIGMPGYPLENRTLNNIHAVFPGGGTVEDAKNILAEFTNENLNGDWPEYGKFKKTVLAFGLYMRHVRGLRIIGTEFTTRKKDARPPVVLIDVVKLKT